MGQLSGVGVKARVATAKRLGLDAHGTTPASVSGGRGCSSPAPRALGGKSGGSKGAKPNWARAEGPLQALKSRCPEGRHFRSEATGYAKRSAARASPFRELEEKTVEKRLSS